MKQLDKSGKTEGGTRSRETEKVEKVVRGERGVGEGVVFLQIKIYGYDIGKCGEVVFLQQQENAGKTTDHATRTYSFENEDSDHSFGHELCEIGEEEFEKSRDIGNERCVGKGSGEKTCGET